MVIDGRSTTLTRSTVYSRPVPDTGSAASGARAGDVYVSSYTGAGRARCAPPAALGEQRMLDEARQFLEARGVPAGDPVETLRGNPELRRDFLEAQAERERSAGKSAVELFSNAAQRSRLFNSRVEGRRFYEVWKPEKRTVIDGRAVATDLSLLFSGAKRVIDGPLERLGRDAYDHRWNVNHPDPLPPTGFRADRVNDDDDGPSADQTHHLAYYTLMGATYAGPLGGFLADRGAELVDRGNPNDIRLAKDGIELGRKLSDPGFDVNAWLWQRVGDCSTLPTRAARRGGHQP